MVLVSDNARECWVKEISLISCFWFIFRILYRGDWYEFGEVYAVIEYATVSTSSAELQTSPKDSEATEELSTSLAEVLLEWENEDPMVEIDMSSLVLVPREELSEVPG